MLCQIWVLIIEGGRQQERLTVGLFVSPPWLRWHPTKKIPGALPNLHCSLLCFLCCHQCLKIHVQHLIAFALFFETKTPTSKIFKRGNESKSKWQTCQEIAKGWHGWYWDRIFSRNRCFFVCFQYSFCIISPRCHPRSHDTGAPDITWKVWCFSCQGAETKRWWFVVRNTVNLHQFMGKPRCLAVVFFFFNWKFGKMVHFMICHPKIVVGSQ